MCALSAHIVCILGSASPVALSIGIVIGVLMLAMVFGICVVILLAIRKSKHYELHQIVNKLVSTIITQYI